ncbi:MAG TPA: hypothetical protein VHK67_03305 [Rhabdochlamydiaceae bacterium]|jgi:hypothetical protein|nr:hypothetical protein [Rhabdochlamydiaceae bacterium]
MSNLAIGAAHLVAIPVRYIVGKWSNISPSTILMFNAADLGFHALLVTIARFVNQKTSWKIPDEYQFFLSTGIRIASCWAAIYATSRLTEQLPREIAVLSNFAGGISVTVAMLIATWREKE